MYLGIDCGSTSIKYSIIDFGKTPATHRIIKSGYRKLHGDLVGSVAAIVGDLSGVEFQGVGVTGSGRELTAKILQADLTVDEITAHRRAVQWLYPEVRTVFEIGGQDSKLIYREGDSWNAVMNTACAAGTGSFLEQQAARLDMDIESFYRKGMRAHSVYPVASKCTVFAESEMITAQGKGISTDRIIRGVHEGLINNYFTTLCLGLELTAGFLFEGATSFNLLLVRALQDRLLHEGLIRKREELYVPHPYNAVMGAIGVAVCLNARTIRNPRLLEPISDIHISEEFACHSCRVNCGALVQELAVGNAKVRVGGCQ